MMFEELGKISKKRAFTLAEIALVLIVYALIALFIPTTIKKMEKEKTKVNLSNRFDCYYKGNVLYQKYGNGGEVEATEKITLNHKEYTACKFEMPNDTLYSEMIAVGGGGAGGDFKGDFPPDENFYSYMELKYNDINTLPDYLKEILNSSNALGQDISADYKLWVGAFLKRQILLYSVSGEPGELVTYFFSKNTKGDTYYILPGRGGLAACTGSAYNPGGNCSSSDGEATYVYKYINDKYEKILEAKGGSVGKLADSRNAYRYSNPLFGSNCNDAAIASSQSILPRSSDFLTQAKTDIDYGASGIGAYSFSTDTSGYLSVVKNLYVCSDIKPDGSCDVNAFTTNGYLDLTEELSNVYFKKLGGNCELKKSSSDLIDFSIFHNARKKYKIDGEDKYTHSPYDAYPFAYDNKSKITAVARYVCTPKETCSIPKCISGDPIEVSIKIDGSDVKLDVVKCNPSSGKDGAVSILW